MGDVKARILISVNGATDRGAGAVRAGHNARNLVGRTGAKAEMAGDACPELWKEK